MKKLEIMIFLSFFVIIVGCAREPKVEIKQPIEVAWGKQGIVPEYVYNDYEWIIMSRNHYERTCK